MRWLPSLLCGAVVVASLPLSGCGRSGSAANDPSLVQLGDAAYRISGPYSHENLTVFLLHGSAKDDADYITLDQGLKDGIVKVSEKSAEGQVSELLIENMSDQPLFLQEGDRLYGGKQDRILYSSLVVPPKSGQMPIPTFCVEQGRWTPRENGLMFANTLNGALAPKEVRQVGKASKDQSAVWEEVGRKKEQASAALNAPNTNSSLNEAFDSEAVKKLSDEFAAALQPVLDDHADAVGVVIVVNGKIEEVNVYPNRRLLSKLYPRLMQSYAFQASVEKEKAKDAPACSVADVNRFMTEQKERKLEASEKIDSRNRLEVYCVDGNKTECTTSYAGCPVHYQVLSGAPAARNAAPRQGPAQQLERSPQQQEPQPTPPPQPPNREP